MRARRAQLNIFGLAGVVALICGGAAGAAPEARARPLEIAQDTGNGIYPAGDPQSKYWTGNATYSKASDGKDVWTYPDKSTAVRDSSGKTEYRDPKGALVRKRQVTSNDTATYDTVEYWNGDGDWVVSTRTEYRDGHSESLTLVHGQGPGGPIKKGWSDVTNLEYPSSTTVFGEGGVFVRTTQRPSLRDFYKGRTERLKTELKTIPVNANDRAEKEKELENAEKRLATVEEEIKKNHEALDAPKTGDAPPPTQGADGPPPGSDGSGPPPGSGSPPPGATMPGFGFGGFGFGFGGGGGFGGGDDRGPSDRGSSRPRRP